MAKTIAQLHTEAQTIKNATITGENTATRVGGCIDDVVEFIGYKCTRISAADETHLNGFMQYNGVWYASNNFDSKQTDLIPCAEGDVFVWNGIGAANYPTPTQITGLGSAVTWIFFDTNKNRLSSWSVESGDNLVTIPSGVCYVQFFGITRNSGGSHSFSVDYVEYTDKIAKDFGDIPERIIPSYLHNGGFMQYNGTWYTSANFNSRFTELIPCSEGDVFRYLGYAGTSSSFTPTQITNINIGVSWIFYNSSKTQISSWQLGRVGSWLVTIPSGVAYVQFAGIIYSSSGVKPFAVWKDDYVKNVQSFKWSGLKWNTFGDSLTEANLRATKNYHDYIHEWTDIFVVNKGVSGSGYKENYSSNKAFYQLIQNADADADVITIFGSGNDLHLSGGVPKYTLGDVTDTGTTTICGCINTTLDWLQANRPLVPLGIISMTPWASTSVPTENQVAYVEKLKDICALRGIPFLNLFECSNLHPNSAAFKNIAYRRDGTYTASTSSNPDAIQVTADNIAIVQAFGVPSAQIGDYVLPNLTGVHPDEAGHKFFAPRIKAFLKTLIEK